MKHLTLLSASILIVLALLLNAANNAQSQSPRPPIQGEAKLTPDRKENATATQQETIGPSATPIVEPTKPTIETPKADESATVHSEEGNPKESHQSESNTWNITQVILQLLFTAATTIATIYLAKFTYRLVEVTKDLHTATKASTVAADKTAAAAQAQLDFTKAANEQNVAITKKAAEATSQSAEISKLALLESRPYLLAGRPTQAGFPKKLEDLADNSAAEINVGCSLKNYGKGPAIISKVATRVCALSGDDFPAFKDFTACDEPDLPQEIIEQQGSLAIANQIFSCFLTKPQCRDIFEYKLTLVFYGQVEYRDVFDNTFVTGFFYFFSPPEAAGVFQSDTGFMVKTPDNRGNFRT